MRLGHYAVNYSLVWSIMPVNDHWFSQGFCCKTLCSGVCGNHGGRFAVRSVFRTLTGFNSGDRRGRSFKYQIFRIKFEYKYLYIPFATLGYYKTRKIVLFFFCYGLNNNRRTVRPIRKYTESNKTALQHCLSIQSCVSKSVKHEFYFYRGNSEKNAFHAIYLSLSELHSVTKELYYRNV